MKRSVGLVFLTELNGNKMCVLHKRGLFNFEEMKPESFPCGCQVTCHGGLEDDEDFFEGLRRESREELGDDMSSLVWSHRQVLVELSHLDTGGKEVVTYGLKVIASTLKMITLGPSSGGLLLLKEGDEILDLRSFPKETGVRDNSVAMFPDEAEAVRNAFKLL